MIGFLTDFVTGGDLDGGRRTNARWSKPGHELVDGDEFTTHPWHYWPRRRRAGIRLTLLVAAGYIAAGLSFDVVPLIDAARMVFWTAAFVGVTWVSHRTRKTQWREEKIVPLFLGLHDLLGYARQLDPTSVLRVPRDYYTNPDHPVEIRLLPSWGDSKARRDRIIFVASERLGMAEPDIEYLPGPDPKMLLRAAPVPPDVVRLPQLEPLLADRPPGQLVLGIGPRDKCITCNLLQENPHIALSVTTGGGKSTIASLIAAQVLHDGGNSLILDPKLVSLNWAKYLPNVRYADTIAAMHDALLWLGGEIQRRAELVSQLADVNGDIPPEQLHLIGVPLLVISEELNTLMPRLQRYWQSIRDKDEPRVSPAVENFREALAMGRQFRVHMLLIAQYLTAAVTGGGEGRENVSTRILIKPTKKAWDMLAGDEYKTGSRYPPTLRGAGRGYVLDAGVAHPTQFGWLRGSEAQEYALSGIVTPFDAPGLATLNRLGALSVPVPGDRVTPASVPDQGFSEAGTQGQTLSLPAPVEDAEVVEEPLVSLLEACQLGILSCNKEAAKQRKRRESDFPAFVAEDERRGQLYRPDELRAFDVDYLRRKSAG